jgi:hypothetical protein
MNARQGSQMTISSGGPASLNEFLTEEQIDTEIKLRSQKGKRRKGSEVINLLLRLANR